MGTGRIGTGLAPKTARAGVRLAADRARVGTVLVLEPGACSGPARVRDRPVFGIGLCSGPACVGIAPTLSGPPPALRGARVRANTWVRATPGLTTTLGPGCSPRAGQGQLRGALGRAESLAWRPVTQPSCGVPARAATRPADQGAAPRGPQGHGSGFLPRPSPCSGRAPVPAPRPGEACAARRTCLSGPRGRRSAALSRPTAWRPVRRESVSGTRTGRGVGRGA